MRVGVVFPQTEIGADAGAVRAYAEHVEASNFTHVLTYDHVVGADPSVHTGWGGPYDVDTTFHEPLVMFGFLAGVTTTIELVTGVIILPPASDRVGRKAGRRGRPAEQWTVAPRRRHRLERRRIRGIGRGFHQPRQAIRGTDRADAQPVDAAQRELQRTLPSFDRGWTGTAARPTTHPGVDRRGVTHAATNAPGDWRTGGSRWSRRPELEAARSIVESGPRSKRVGIRPPSAWKGASAGGRP